MSPVIVAVATLKIANGHPKKAADTRMESTPVCGVLIKKAVVDPSLAPSFLRPSPAGITPQEHRGRGTPSKTAFPIPEYPVRVLARMPGGKKRCRSTEMKAPRKSHGANSTVVCQIASKNHDFM